jgi:vancomycin resistance protein YoaR
MRAEATTTPLVRRRRLRDAGARAARLGLAATGLVALVALAVLWLAFAGSAARLAEGVTIAGVDVGGLTPAQARRELERRAAAVAARPVSFTAGDESWSLTPRQLGIAVDWAAAVEAARREGDGFGPVRGIRRLQTRVFGADIAPPVRVYDAALDYHVRRIAGELARPPREAAIELRGLRPALVPAQTGRRLDRDAAEATVVRALAAFGRAPVGLPVRVQPPTVTTAELRPVVAEVQVALSAPVRLALGETRWRLPRWRVAELLALPSNGVSTLRIGGPKAEAWLDALGRRVERAARDASFAAGEGGVVAVVPSQPGVGLDPVATADALLRAVLQRQGRLAHAVVVETQPELTTEKAAALGVTRVLATYTTLYAGSADRIHNLQLAVSLLDGARVAPGATFSFNARVGERTLERGFRVAPVIVGGKYEEDVGGGVSQVATTVFNAAWEAGLPIPERNPHALYIGRYPLGRDATVNYPNLDLRFVNDTGGWLVLRAGSGSSGIWVSLLGPDTGRRVESTPGPLRETGPPKTEAEKDPTLPQGQTVVESEGQPSRAVSVERVVYDGDGKVLRRETWTTSYRSEPKLVRVGTKPKPPAEKKPKPPAAAPPDEAGAPPTATTPATPPPAPESPGRPDGTPQPQSPR